MNQHTPTPWAIDPNTGEICATAASGYVTICDPTMARYEASGKSLPVDERQANAERIVQCVNAHDELVAELTRLTDILDGLNADGACSWRGAVKRARGLIARSAA